MSWDHQDGLGDRGDGSNEPKSDFEKTVFLENMNEGAYQLRVATHVMGGEGGTAREPGGAPPTVPSVFISLHIF